MKLFVNDLTIMDFSYLCPRRGMVGESWIVDIILNGGLNDESMIQDFGTVKKQLKILIDNYIDHKLVVPADYANTYVSHDDDSDNVEVLFTYSKQKGQQEHILLKCPSEAYAFVYSNQIDMQSVIDYLKDIISTQLPGNVEAVDIKLRTEQINSAFYHYTHALKKHDGNCQRIAHGHRSKIWITLDEIRNSAMEEHWANKWRDIYIGTEEDLVDLACCRLTDSAISLGVSKSDYFAFEYESSQGEFSLVIPKNCCDIIQADSTVECIAQHIYDQVKIESPNRLSVQAYEGVGKGAIVNDE